MQRPLTTSARVDRFLFLLGAAVAIWLSVIIAIQGFVNPVKLLLLIPVWAIMAYLALPRLHRMLSDLYVPDYFFGRTRTGDGLLGDPVNLGVDGTLAQLDTVMTDAGWHRADEITLQSTWGIIASTLFRRSYPTAPVSPLFLFRRRHDVAYQQEVEGNAKQRHHVRFWHCPPKWLLPGGARTEWLGAGTYDTDVGLSLFTLQVTHRIDENTDVERDYVVESMTHANDDVSVRWLRDFTTGYHSRNGGGDRFITDGHLPIVDLRAVTASEEAVTHAIDEPDSTVADELKQVSTVPLAVILGTVGVVVGAILAVISMFTEPLVSGPDDPLAGLDEQAVAAMGAGIIGFLVAILAVELWLSARVLRGRAPRSRVALVLLIFVGIVAMAVSYWTGEYRLALDGTLLAAVVHSGAMIALTSESAASWARWGRNGPPIGEE